MLTPPQWGGAAGAGDLRQTDGDDERRAAAIEAIERVQILYIGAVTVQTAYDVDEHVDHESDHRCLKNTSKPSVDVTYSHCTLYIQALTEKCVTSI